MRITYRRAPLLGTLILLLVSLTARAEGDVRYAGEMPIVDEAGQETIYLDRMPLAQTAGAGLKSIHLDHRLAALAISDDSGQPVWRAATDPFAGSGQAVGLPGQQYDKESGLNYNRHRYYDDQSGRYLKADPVGLRSQLNLYAYVGGEPVGWIDPSGLSGEHVVRPTVQYDGEQDSSSIVVIADYSATDAKTEQMALALAAQLRRGVLVETGGGAKLPTCIEECELPRRQGVKVYDVQDLQTFREVMDQERAMAGLHIIGHGSEYLVRFGPGFGHSRNSIHQGNVISFDWSGLLPDAEITLWGCHNGGWAGKRSTLSPVAQFIADASERKVHAANDYTKSSFWTARPVIANWWGRITGQSAMVEFLPSAQGKAYLERFKKRIRVLNRPPPGWHPAQ